MGKEKNFAIETVPKNDETSVLLEFDNGQIKSESSEKLLFFPSKRDSTGTNEATVIARHNIFHGVINSNFHNDLDDIYICVRRKDSSKVEILQADHARLSNYLYKSQENKKATNISKNDQLKLLMKEFGSRKASRSFANQQNLQINVEAVKDQLDSTLNESNITEISNTGDLTEENINKIRPPFNKNASELEDIYNIDDLIAPDLFERLDEESRRVFSADIEILPISSEYLLNKIQKHKSIESPRNLNNIKIIIYMDCLRNLIKTNEKQGFERMQLSGITEKVENDVKRRFFDRNSTIMKKTTYTTEKAICYYLVMDLLLNRYQSDVNVISQELGVPKQKLLKLASFVNASVKPRSDTLTLRLPSSMKPLQLYRSRKFKK